MVCLPKRIDEQRDRLNIEAIPSSGVLIRVRGIVQGVGFRPFVYRLAQGLHLTGGVKNTGDGVEIEVWGERERIGQFLQALERERPPLATIRSLSLRPLIGHPPKDFKVFKSTSGVKKTYIPPDVATCEACLRELFDPKDRRYRYPFINCTDCGPRYTVIEDLPYDRKYTSMKVFPLCPECHREYVDPSNRRFHAEPNACPVCGPHLWVTDARGEKIEVKDPLRFIIERLREGKICALKGLGGFHLAVDATDERAVALLRARKHRPTKPLAVMVKDIETARKLAYITPEEENLLLSPRRPIVLLRKKEPFPLAPSVAPGINLIGLMLPYTPLHHLLLAEGGFLALVMTSGNLSQEPLCYRNKEALARLNQIADFFLLHDREIVIGIDDSVVRVIAGKGRLIRRARGLVPEVLPLPRKIPPTLAVGALLKNTFTLTRGEEAFVSQHLGDLEDLKTLEFFEAVFHHLAKLLDFEPEILVCDLHPEFMSTRLAEEWAKARGLPLLRVQHHVAHALATMAERGLKPPLLALVLDGLGYGEDGHIWGGEVFLIGQDKVKRLGHLEEVPQPGGDAAAKEPWRMALSYLLSALGKEKALELSAELLPKIPREKTALVFHLIRRRFNAPLTSSAGRLFDAVAAILGISLVNHYEGEAAMRLEALAAKGETIKTYPLPLIKRGKKLVWETSTLLRNLLKDYRQGTPPSEIAASFHLSLAKGLAKGLCLLAQETGLKKVLLSGGCFQNALLTEALCRYLIEFGLRPFLPENIPLNDGGLSYGQAAWVAIYAPFENS